MPASKRPTGGRRTPTGGICAVSCTARGGSPASRHGGSGLPPPPRRREVDLVHCADLPAAPVAALAARLARIPALCHVRNRYTEPARADRRWYWAVHKFAFVSQATWGYFGYRVPPRRGVVVYDGVAVPERVDRRAARARLCETFDVPPDAPIVGMVARMEPQKDYRTLVAAAARLRRSHPLARYVIVGGISALPEYRRHLAVVRGWLDEHGMTDRFVFTDYQADVPQLMAAMDVFVLSTHNEGLPLVVLEAMAMGLPVVATSVDGMPEVIRHGMTGLLAPHEDAERLAQEIGAVLGDAGLAHRLGSGARDEVARRFTVDRFGADMRGVYVDMLGSRRMRRWRTLQTSAVERPTGGLVA
jgi:glycosyltransferase involved in cell wall biosynthesis